jgi:hypothetical protein
MPRMKRWGPILLLAWAAQARAEELVAGGERPAPARDAAQATRDGALLPLSLSPRVGDQRVAALSLGGYDTAPGHGAAFSTVVEGALFRRVAVRAGIEYVPQLQTVSPQAGARVAILGQERFGLDLGVAALYKNLGFSEARGELELAVLVARRWGRAALFGNLVYGQGLDAGERDAEARCAFLFGARPWLNVGLDVRARLDLGADDAAREAKQLTSSFDLVGGPLVSVAVSHVMFLAQLAPHVLVMHDQPRVGVAALGGVGTAF